jgi:hypothetical protein
MSTKPKSDSVTSDNVTEAEAQALESEKTPVPEKGGRGGLEPTRYGDWEVGGICSDF